MDKKSVIIANITYNPSGWREIYINPHAGHSYARNHPGHESLNFKFDKKHLDTKQYIHGYVQWTRPPAKFINGGIIIFYTWNLEKRFPEIVGIYCDAHILPEPIITPYKDFENDKLISNMKGNIDYSMLFPIPLKASEYSTKRKRLVGQVGYGYNDIQFAEQVIIDEFKSLEKLGIQAKEDEKLNRIYKFITGSEYVLGENEIKDQKEQDEIVEIIKPLKKEEIIDELSNLKLSEPEEVVVKQKTYKRDNKTIAQLKILRNFKCQICGFSVLKKDGELYVESAHIVPKRKKGTELPENILILCPNHHKEFDLGKLTIIKHNKNIISFELNGKSYSINLKLE